MAILEIPKGPDALSPEWLTAALQSSGATKARVASFEYEPIAAGVGFLGKLGRTSDPPPAFVFRPYISAPPTPKAATS